MTSGGNSSSEALPASGGGLIIISKPVARRTQANHYEASSSLSSSPIVLVPVSPASYVINKEEVLEEVNNHDHQYSSYYSPATIINIPDLVPPLIVYRELQYPEKRVFVFDQATTYADDGHDQNVYHDNHMTQRRSGGNPNPNRPFREFELGKIILGIVSPATAILLAVQNWLYPTSSIAIVPLFALCLGPTFIVIGIAHSYTFPGFARATEELGISLLFLAFFWSVSCILTKWYLMVLPWLCFLLLIAALVVLRWADLMIIFPHRRRGGGDDQVGKSISKSAMVISAGT